MLLGSKETVLGMLLLLCSFICTWSSSVEKSNRITLVLTATLNDGNGMPRFPCLLASLEKFAGNETVEKLIIVAPASQRFTFQKALGERDTQVALILESLKA